MKRILVILYLLIVHLISVSGQCKFSALRQDLTALSPQKRTELLDFFHSLPKKTRLNAWDLLIDHPNIRVDVSSLASVHKILDNSNISGVISKADLKIVVQKLAAKGVKCRTCVNGNSTRYLDEVLDDLEHGAVKFGTAYAKVISDIKAGNNFTEGAMWVAEGVRKYSSDFPANSTVFEEVIENGARRVDVKVGNILYEFKSNATAPLFGFDVAQFIKDMSAGEVSNLNQIKWWFDEKKVVSNLPKQQFLNQIEIGLQNLDPNIRQSIISKLSPVNNQTLNGLLIKIDTEFSTIFIRK